MSRLAKTTYYHWCLEKSRTNSRKVVFNANPNKRGSTTSIDSLGMSENDRNIKCNRRKLVDEARIDTNRVQNN